MNRKHLKNNVNCDMSDIPSWYWSGGLHDARIIAKSYYSFDYGNYPKTQYQNCIELKLDLSQAMFDTSIKAVRFYNCREMTPDIDIENLWWIRDDIVMANNKFVAKIELFSQKRTCLYIIRFEHCEVERI